MRRWRADGFPDSPRRAAILLAIEEHDNGWREVDAAPVLDVTTGRILDFISAPDSVRRGVWPRGVQRLAAEPCAAALVAQHAMHVYGRYRTALEWRPFFAEMAPPATGTYKRALTCQSDASMRAWYSASEMERLEYRHAVTNMFLS